METYLINTYAKALYKKNCVLPLSLLVFLNSYVRFLASRFIEVEKHTENWLIRNHL